MKVFVVIVILLVVGAIVAILASGGPGVEETSPSPPPVVRPGPTCNTYYDEHGELQSCPEFHDFSMGSGFGYRCVPIGDYTCSGLPDQPITGGKEFNCSFGLAEVRSSTRPCLVLQSCGLSPLQFRVSHEGFCWTLKDDVFVEAHCSTVPRCRRLHQISLGEFESQPVSVEDIDASGTCTTGRNIVNPCLSIVRCSVGQPRVVICVTGRTGICVTRDALGYSCFGDCTGRCGYLNFPSSLQLDQQRSLPLDVEKVTVSVI